MDYKDRIIGQLNKQLEEQNITISALTGTITNMEQAMKDLQETVRELRRQLAQDSHNSSKPPSTDGYRKPSSRSQRKPSGKKQGGQKGHAGNHMEIPHAPDEVKAHYPSKCQNCPSFAKCVGSKNAFKCGESRYEVGAKVTTTVTEHQSMIIRECPCGESELRGEFPEGVRAYVQYGDSVTILVGLLSTYGAISAMRIHTLVGSLLGVSLSTATVTSMVSKCAAKVGPTMKWIQTIISGSDVGNFDETGARVNGKLFWVHSSSTPEYTYQTISPKRGQEGMEDNGVLSNFNGIAVHDCWAPYWKYDVQHAICGAHLLRELTGIQEYSPEHKWAARFANLLLEMKKTKEKAMTKGNTELSYYHLHKFSKAYDQVMATADTECPAPPDPPGKKKGRKKLGRERALIERLMSLKGAVCLFIHDFKVPFDNNQAERDVRNVKTKTKIAGCFRTIKGGQDYLDVMSYISTGRKHGISAFDALTQAFAGNAEIVLQCGF